MTFKLSKFWLSTIIFFSSSIATGAGSSLNATGVSHIPFKAEGTPLVEHSARVGWGMVLFIVILGFVLYLFRKKISYPFVTGNKRTQCLKLKESLKLNVNCNLYLVEYNQQEILISQAGDKIVCLSHNLTIGENVELESKN